VLADRAERERSVEPVIEAYLPRLFASQTLERNGDVVRRGYEIARENSFAGMAATLRGIALRAPSDDIAEDLDIPALVIAGDGDRVVAAGEARAMAQRFPRARLVECAASGHLPMLEEPQAVTAAILSWLSS